jgi:hypothetical protein
MKQYNVSSTSVTASGQPSGTVLAGKPIFMGSDIAKVGSLTALVSFTANTSTLTVAGKWQGSNDSTTWVDLFSANNAANVTYATGTLAAKAASLDAPQGAYGWRFSRFVFVTGVTTGAAADVGTIAYNYRQLIGGEAVLV